MGKSNTELLKIAEKYLGCGGSKFRKFCGLPAGAAWCNAFVDTIAAEGGDAHLYFDGKKYTYCPTSIKWCQRNLAQIPIYLALPMDIIYFDWELNGIPNHIGFVRERKSDLEVYTIEGNTSGGIVAKKTRPVKYVQGVFRPHFKGSFDANKALTIDGYFGYNSIACLQKALKITVDGILGKGTVKALQKKAGVSQDGSWGPNTSKAVQKMVGTPVDGFFGPKSVKALQTWINKQNAKPVVKSSASKIVDKAKELAWPAGTSASKYAFDGGSATSKFKSALNKYYPKHMSWGEGAEVGASCDVFVAVTVMATGLSKDFPRGLDEQLKYTDKDFQVLVYHSVAPIDVVKSGDIIEYYKDKDGSNKHTCIMGNGVIYEAQYKKTYGHVNTSLKKLKTKRPYVRILRAK